MQSIIIVTVFILMLAQGASDIYHHGEHYRASGWWGASMIVGAISVLFINIEGAIK